jgi:UDP-N-acetylglucosamine/UDP-N-acetylgalactosamine diphosphorylase
VFFFQQGDLPCVTLDGKLIMATPHSIATAPDGNGGVYLALQKSGALADMQQHGVQCIDCYSVDNALAKLGDPVFVGHCWEQQAECGARVLSKAHPHEKVGVFALRNGKLEVVEYSEIDHEQATSTDAETGQLLFNWSNICMHYFSVPFLEAMATKLKEAGCYHLAKKSIPSKDGPVQGYKLELFIFDTFPLSQKTSLMEVNRQEYFAPVKNAPGSPTDSPETARAAILKLHGRWVKAAGGAGPVLEADGQGIEVSPLVSYAGESLEGICKGQTFNDVLDARLQ